MPTRGRSCFGHPQRPREGHLPVGAAQPGRRACFSVPISLRGQLRFPQAHGEGGPSPEHTPPPPQEPLPTPITVLPPPAVLQNQCLKLEQQHEEERKKELEKSEAGTALD